MAPTPSRGSVQKQLKQLHDDPVNTEGAQDSILEPPYDYLLAIKPDGESVIHWFCPKADAVAREAAVFLLRLFAYSNVRVLVWKKALLRCLHGCFECSQAFIGAKITSRTTYFGAFSESVLQNFFLVFDKWEAESIVEIIIEYPHSSSRSAFDNAPMHVVYHMLCSLHAVHHEKVQFLLVSHPPSFRFPDSAMFKPPPGLFLLLMHQSAEVRKWARSQNWDAQLPGKLGVMEPYDIVMKNIVSSVNRSSSSVEYQATSPEFKQILASPLDVLWLGFASVARAAPLEYLGLTKYSTEINILKIVLTHIHDEGSNFPGVLQSFIFLLRRLGVRIWEGESTDYPQVIFDAVKDNPAFLQLCTAVDKQGSSSWFLTWPQDYLKTVWTLPIFDEVLLQIVGFLSGELQHERFKTARPLAMTEMFKLLTLAIHRAKDEKNPKRLSAILDLVDLHSDLISSVAFGKEFRASEWQTTSRSAISFIRETLTTDIENTAASIAGVGNKLPPINGNVVVVPYRIRKSLWSRVYTTVRSDDSEGMKILMELASLVAHHDRLSSSAFSSKNLPTKDQNDRASFDSVIVHINDSLSIFRGGFLDVTSKFSNRNSPSVIIELLKSPDMVKNTIMLMLSPVGDLRNGAEALIGQAYDVDGRIDCFRALIRNHSEDSLKGILQYLKTFNSFAPNIPEACEISKTLVRCLTDVIDVLSNPSDGLLLDDEFMASQTHQERNSKRNCVSAELPELWKSMSVAITTIFKKTPSWANYFSNDIMVEWMRDALIFGRDMLAQRQLFERSSQIAASKSEQKVVGQKMIDNLQEVLSELTRWLRLTDEELLHQSFAFLQSLLDCFCQSSTSLWPQTLAKLTKFVDAGRSTEHAQRTRLDSARLAKLEDALASFEAEDPAPSQNVGEKGSKVTELKANEVEDNQHSFYTIKSQDLRDVFPGLSKPTVAKEPPKPKPELPKVESRVAVKPVIAPPVHSKQPKPRLPPPPAVESSSSSEESDEEENKTSLRALDKFQRSPQKFAKPKERRQIKMLDAPTMRDPVQERLHRRQDARRIALRLKPDLGPLYRMILSWNYDHTGAQPPGPPAKYTRIPDRFSSYEHYRQVIGPLLAMECWAQIVQSKEARDIELVTCKVLSRQFVDDWLDVELTSMGPTNKEWRLLDTEIVLLRRTQDNRCLLAKVRHHKNAGVAAVLGLRCYLADHVDPGLQHSSEWSVRKVFSLSTLHREYAALAALQHYDLCDMILQPQLKNTYRLNPNDVSRTMSSYRVNEPQAKAILSSLNSNGFSLIQGPPGTGKTWTICSLVSAHLSTKLKVGIPIATGKTREQMNKESGRKVLICAPSNAAIDEVVKRLKNGIRTAQGTTVVPKVVRVGMEASMHINVKEVALDALVDIQLNSGPGGQNSAKDLASEMTKLRSDLDSLKALIKKKQDESENIQDNAAKTLAYQNELNELQAKRRSITQKLDQLRDRQKSENRTLDAERRRFRQQVLSDCDVICSTLAGAGHEILESFEFDMIIIDEAAQAVELSSLIPLKYSCDRCIMVGDPQQLPPTVLSPEACKWGYDQSLFLRIQRQKPDAVHLLSIQYRMHPDISRLPSRLFYNNRLADGPNMATSTKRPWHKSSLFGVYKFINVSRGREEQGSGHSLINDAECQVAVALFDRLRREFSSYDFDHKVGVISMYRAQIVRLRKAFREKFGIIADSVDFNTVDGFQGQEKEIIILSCVRAGPGLDSVGFLADLRRMNVAITRCQSSLFILGNEATLSRSNVTWKQLVNDARERSCLVQLDVKDFRSPTSTQVIASTPSTSNAKKPLPPSSTSPTKLRESGINNLNDLKTPKDATRSMTSAELMQLKRSQSTKDPLGESSKNSQPQAKQSTNKPDTHGPEEPDDDVGTSNKPQPKRKLSDGSDKQIPKPRPPPKRPKKETTMFIPKKKPL